MWRSIESGSIGELKQIQSQYQDCSIPMYIEAIWQVKHLWGSCTKHLRWSTQLTHRSYDWSIRMFSEWQTESSSIHSKPPCHKVSSRCSIRNSHALLGMYWVGRRRYGRLGSICNFPPNVGSKFCMIMLPLTLTTPL